MKNQMINSLSVQEFKNKMKEDYVLIDVRTFLEVQQGRLKGMDIIIDYYLPTFTSKIEKLDRNKKYLLYCRSGGRTGMTLNLMKELGFNEVYDLKGGIISWTNEGEKCVN